MLFMLENYFHLMISDKKVNVLKIIKKRKGKRTYLTESKNQFNPLSANPTKWSNKLKQFVGRRIV